MRKHPLIALTAFTALTASAVAGASSGSFEPRSTFTTARTQQQPSDSSPVAYHGASATTVADEFGHLGPSPPRPNDPGRLPWIRLRDLSGLPLLVHDGGPRRAVVARHYRARLDAHLERSTASATTTTTTTTTAEAPPSPVPPPTPSTTTSTEPAPARAGVAAVVSQPPAPAGGVWYELRLCESGGNYAENSGNGYYGAYQFSLSTWYGLGFTGLPSQATPATQDRAAQVLQAESGWGQWPSCSAQLGL